jgi:CubicO group peptidase (beta-lactamase class C family)
MTLAARLARRLDELSRKDAFSGAVLVRQGGRNRVRAAYGYAVRGWQVPNRSDTRFRIASISKMFTAVAVLQLIDAGELSLDTPLAGYLGLQGTTVPPDASVYHMLTMTSGMADWFDESGDWAANWAALIHAHPIYLLRRNEDYLPLFAGAQPPAPAGAGYRYNGAGYILLGMAIERASGMPYFDYVRRHIFEPAGMARSDFVALDAAAPEVAEGYLPADGGGWLKNVYSTTPEAAADGGATSTLDDLARFSRALRQGWLLSAGMTQAMLTPHVLESEERPRGYTWKYSYGVQFILDDAGRIVRWGHTGEEDGVSCRLYYYPEQDTDVVILGNQSRCAGELGWEIHEMVVGWNGGLGDW